MEIMALFRRLILLRDRNNNSACCCSVKPRYSLLLRLLLPAFSASVLMLFCGHRKTAFDKRMEGSPFGWKTLSGALWQQQRAREGRCGRQGGLYRPRDRFSVKCERRGLHHLAAPHLL
jgi:hypothetical protein